MGMKIAQALKQWKEAQTQMNQDPDREGPPLETDPAKAKSVELQFQKPLIKKMDATLSTLVECEFLSLSTNNIDKVSGLAGMQNLKILSLGRNNIKDAVANTLEQLWMSYNSIEKLIGIEKLLKLRVFYISNNKIKDWGEVSRLRALPVLSELVLKGNPVRKAEMTGQEYVREVKKRVPYLRVLDGEACGGDDED